MRYNTGNPVGPDGSSSPLDLYDNSGVIDLLLNGPLGEYLSRLGVPLKSWRGIMQQVTDYLIAQGYESVYLAYGAGVVVERQTQLVQRSGELYRVLNSEDLPLTLTGNWAVDAPKLQAVGDAALRQALASAEGSNFVGHDTGTVGDALRNIDSKVIALNTNFSQLSAVGNQLVDLHFGICHGTGWVEEPGGMFTQAAVQVSAFAVSVENPIAFTAGQLLSYLAGDGEYYTCVIIDINVSTKVLTMSSPLPAALGENSTIGNFYNDPIHPNVNGYRAIADAAIRQANRTYTRVYSFPLGTTTPVAGGVTSPLTDDTYTNPGGVNTPVPICTAPSPGGGWDTEETSLPSGDYLIRLRIATSGTPGLFGCICQVVEDTIGDSIVFQEVVSSFRPTTVDLPFHARKGAKYKVRIQATGENQSFIVSKAEVVQVAYKVRSLDYGVHVLLGDSWFNLPGIFERLQERLPNATIINQGIQGHKMIDLWARYHLHVAPYSPDFVWLMDGTNDYVANTPVNIMNTYLGKISSMTRSLGAALIAFNSSVGPAVDPERGDQLLRRSREYVNVEEYLPEK